jgi:hypothetical protein
MKALGGMIRGLAGLFVDDGLLALKVVAVVLLAGAVAKLIPGAPLGAGGILLFGCLATLFCQCCKGRGLTAVIFRGAGLDMGRRLNALQ